MKLHRVLLSALALCGLLTLQSANAASAEETMKSLIGTWSIIDYRLKEGDKPWSESFPLGPRKCIFIFTADGWVSFQSFYTKPDDRLGKMNPYNGYFGKYTITPDGKAIQYVVEGARNLTSAGEKRTSPFTWVDKDTIQFIPAERTSANGVKGLSKLVFKRVTAQK